MNIGRGFSTTALIFIASFGAKDERALGDRSVSSSPVIPFPAIPEARSSDIFRAEAGGQPLFVEAYKDIHYVHFGLIREADATVTTKEPWGEVRLLPARLSVDFHLNEKTLTLRMSPGMKLVVQSQGRERLFLFADRLDPDAPQPANPGVLDVASFLEPSFQGKRQTDQIQRAIDQVPKGGTLWMGPGLYRSGTLQLKSHMTLYLAPGARLQGSCEPDDYPLFWASEEARKGNNGERFSFSQFLLVDGAKNVRIAGHGVLDGCGSKVRAAGRRAYLLRVRDSQDVLIEDVVLRDSAAWNTHILYSEDVVVRDIKMLNDRSVGNTDGINPDSSCRVTIEDNFAYCGDDCVAVKSTNNSGLLRNVKDIVVRGNVFLTYKSALKVGTETMADVMEDILFEGNDVLECDRGMSLYLKDGATFKNIRFVGNQFDDVYLNNRRRMIDFSISKRHGLGRMEGILIKDCRFRVPFPERSTIAGYDKHHPIDGLRFVDFFVAGRACRSAKEAGIGIWNHVKNVRFETTD